MAGLWGVKPMFTQLSLNAWAFWIVMFVMIVTFFALIRIIYLICLRKFKRESINVIEVNDEFNPNSTQAIYASVIAPHYFYNNDQLYNESVNALKDESNNSFKYFEKMMKKDETIDTSDGVDSVSESFESKTPIIRPLTPAYKPLEQIPKEDPLGFLSVPPGFVTTFGQNNNYFRIERTTHSA